MCMEMERSATLPLAVPCSAKFRLEAPQVRFDNAGHVIQNDLLSNLSAGEFTVLRPHLEWVRLPIHSILHQSGEDIESGFFLNEGITSLVVFTNDGRSVEVGIVGREGFVGTPLAAGLRHSPFDAVEHSRLNTCG